MAGTSDLSERLRFIGLGEQERKHLSGHAQAIEKGLPAVLGAFYGEIAKWPELVALFGGDAGLDRARAAQGRHWKEIANARFSDSCISAASRIRGAASRACR